MLKSTKYIGDSQQPKVADNSSPISKEDLPLPWVHYPFPYGGIFAFSETESSKKYICECNLASATSYIKFYAMDLARGFDPIPLRIFPPSFIESFSNPKEVSISDIPFAPKLCHRCNMRTPEFRFCSEMYGSKFKQFYGWYMILNQFKFGVDNLYRRVIREACPEALLKLIDEILDISEKCNKISTQLPSTTGKSFHEVLAIIAEYKENSELVLKRDIMLSLQTRVPHINRKIEKYIEDYTRAEFGFRKIGEGWVSETQLYNIVKQLFKKSIIIRHYRPKILDLLELDIYIVEQNLGIEYQGQQHFHPIKAWGGKKALDELKSRDDFKKKLCKANGITLIEFDYTEPIIESYVRSKLQKYLLF